MMFLLILRAAPIERQVKPFSAVFFVVCGEKRKRRVRESNNGWQRQRKQAAEKAVKQRAEWAGEGKIN